MAACCALLGVARLKSAFAACLSFSSSYEVIIFGSAKLSKPARMLGAFRLAATKIIGSKALVRRGAARRGIPYRQALTASGDESTGD